MTSPKEVTEPPENRIEAERNDAPRELNRLDVLRGLKIATWEASFATVWASLTSGAFLTGYALWLGADSVAIGFLTAIPTFAGLIQVVSSYFGERLKARKPFAAWFFTLGRTLWLPILLLPILLPRSVALLPFLALFALSYVLQNMPVPAYMSWMSDLVPPDHRGRYFGRRNMIAGVVGMVIGLPAAWFLDRMTKQAHQPLWGFGTLFGIAVGGALLSFACLLRQPEPPKRAAPSSVASGGWRGALDYYRAPFADKNFRRLMGFNTIFSTGQFFAAPFFTVYALQNLHISYVTLQILATLTSVASLSSMPLWGYLADKFGNKPLLIIGVCGVFTLPLFWFFTTPDSPTLNFVLLPVNFMAGGLFWAGVGLTQFNLLISFSPSAKTPVYVAVMAATTGAAGGLAPLLGSATMRALDGWTGHLFGMTLTNYHVTFLIAAILRLSALIFLRPIVDARATTAKNVLQQLGRSGPRAWLNIRKLQQGGGEEARLRATGALAESRTRLALNELTTALHDPSFAVREEAARALGEIGDPEAVEALTAALQDPAAGLIAEASRALGRIGDRRATPALIAVLRDAEGAHTRGDRLAAARALGDLGGHDATLALLEQLAAADLTETGDEEMVETLVRALGETGDRRATPALATLLEQADTPRALRVALIRSLSELDDRAALPALHATLTTTTDDPALLTLLADALARLGDSEAIPPLLERLPALESPVARKQVANAIGTLLGEGEGVYSLLAQEEFARDSSVSRLVQEMQRRLRPLPDAPNLDAALESYVSGDYAACARHLESASRSVPLSASETAPQTLCRQTLSALAAQSETPPVESVLLALFALRSLLRDDI